MYVNFHDLISSHEDNSLYQFKGIENTSDGNIINIGNYDEQVYIKILEKEIKQCKCIMYIHTYFKDEINDSIILLSLNLEKNNKIIGSITLEYLIYNIMNEKVNGIYKVYLNINNKKIELNTIIKYPGDDKIIYNIIEYLSHDKVLIIYND